MTNYAAAMQGSEHERTQATIKQLLAELGIEVRKTSEGQTRELWRGDQMLGHFTASGAVERFL